MKLKFVLIAFILVLAAPAEARRYLRPLTAQAGQSCDFPEWCPNGPGPSQFLTSGPVLRAGGAAKRVARGRAGPELAAGTGIVAHPAGCPTRAFCGCGAAVRVFGHAVRSLYLAANWLRFPRASPAPGMVAARRGHVFVLESNAGDGNWLVYDANSGHGGTRIHVRSLAGYTIVNPRA